MNNSAFKIINLNEFFEVLAKRAFNINNYKYVSIIYLKRESIIWL